jgi:hypothetical protein
VKVILNDMLAKYRPLKRRTLADRASMRGVLRIAGQWVLARRQAGSADQVITALRVQRRLGRNEPELTEVIREEGTPRL